jgi:hypothetical protein
MDLTHKNFRAEGSGGARLTSHSGKRSQPPRTASLKVPAVPSRPAMRPAAPNARASVGGARPGASLSRHPIRRHFLGAQHHIPPDGGETIPDRRFGETLARGNRRSRAGGAAR